MIKSTKTSLKFSNKTKLVNLQSFLHEYRRVVSIFVDKLWDLEKVPNLLPKEYISDVETWLSARSVQCAGKQASGIVRGTKQKQKQRLFIIEKLNKTGYYKKARALKRIYDTTIITKPKIDNIQPELDSRFIKIDLENTTSFDGWITITSIGNRIKLVIPVKKTKHFNKMLNLGKLKSGIRLSKHNITFMFDIPEVVKKESGSVLGIDIGQTSVLACSNGFISSKNKHGHDLVSITKVMSRKKKGSKGFKRSASHRTNHINWSVNQLNFSGVKQVNLEHIKHLRKGQRTSRGLSHWTYTTIFDKLQAKCEEQGVLVQTISPTYTSQRCSSCGWVRKRNRNGKLFKCSSCGFTMDADLNAAFNISLPLISIAKEQRLKQENRVGFYWNVLGQANIVPVTQKTEYFS